MISTKGKSLILCSIEQMNTENTSVKLKLGTRNVRERERECNSLSQHLFYGGKGYIWPSSALATSTRYQVPGLRLQTK